MINVTRDGDIIGHIERFHGNKPNERWMAFRPRLANDLGPYPDRRKGFRTRKEAISWLDGAEHQAPSENAPRT